MRFRSSVRISLLFGVLILTGNSAFGMGENGGVRLLLHIAEPHSWPDGKVTEDPCLTKPLLRTANDLVTEYSGEADTVLVWVYLYHPRLFTVKAFGFGIEYSGIDVITSGSCLPLVWQDPETMGTWAESGSEIAFAATDEGHPEGFLEPVAWFVLARLTEDASFRLHAGQSTMSGQVAGVGMPPPADDFWDYGQIGFGKIKGENPIPGPDGIARTYGAVTIRAR